MPFTDVLLASLSALLVQIPLYIVYGVGLTLAFTRWNKHPRASLLAAIAYSASIVISIILTIIQVSLPYQMSAQEVGAVYSILGICGNLVHAALAAVLVAAIFGWRKADDTATP